MDKSIYTKIDNVLKAEAEYIMKHEENTQSKANKMNTIFNLKKIIDNYEELEPLLIEHFSKKAQKEKWEIDNHIPRID